ncbi:MAG: hypothetical protein A3J51_05760 [Omnitrophica WOR_2 bacterium RIFCSPHIGHO2_02_FULL_45_21]|nr:MAG: hypothetical protein A3J51_05760 [Omnitrophica WOR_2 bacterium RIFCSPHIGHO2_02_FULL_45_21]
MKTQINPAKIKRRWTQIILLSTTCCLLFTLIGCAAFVRKFTRKPKGEPEKEEPVIQPEVYPDLAADKDQLYKDYSAFWEGWADQLMEFLNEKANFKKQRECAYEALDNLIKMRELLNEEKAKSLESLINEFTAVKTIIFTGRLSSPDYNYLKNKVERIKSGVHRHFAHSKISKDLK